MEPIKAISVVLLLITAGLSFWLMARIGQRGEPRNLEQMARAAVCWSMGMSTLGMSLHLGEADYWPVYVWWRASVLAFVAMALYMNFKRVGAR